jgi:type I restriction enzyme, S subunit
MSEYLFKDILLETKDGEWGKGEPGEDLVRMKVIRGTDFEAVRNFRLDDVPERFILRHIAERKSLKPYDILLETAGGTRDQPTGRSVILKPELFKKTDLPITCASFSRFLRVNSDIANPEYIFWWLQYMYESRKIEVFHVQHTGVARFQYTLFATTTNINLPPNDEQSEIARTLSCLDKRIELNQRMNITLEGIALAIFKSWFVDFDPVKAKAEGRKPEDMDEPTASLFPSTFTESALGPIPEGWIVNDLGNLSNIAIGRTPPRKEPEWFTENPSDNKWISIRDLGEASVFIMRASEYLTNEAVEKFRIPLIKAGTVVLSFKLTLGRVAIAAEDMYSNEAIAQFKLDKSPLNSIYLYFYLKNYNYNNLGSTSSIATAVNSQILKTINTVVAPPAVLAAFEKQTLPIIQKIKSNLLCTKILSETRNLLLPRLISGKLRIGNLPEEADAS